MAFVSNARFASGARRGSASSLRLLSRLVKFGGAVNQYGRLKREHEQANKSRKHSAQRQTIQNITSRKRVQQRLCRPLAYVLASFADYRFDSIFHPVHSAFRKLSNDFGR